MSYNSGIPQNLDTAMRTMSNVARNYMKIHPISRWQTTWDAAMNLEIDEPMRLYIEKCGISAINHNTNVVREACAVIADQVHNFKYSRPMHKLWYLHCGEKWDAPLRNCFRFDKFTPLDELWEQYRANYDTTYKVAWYIAMEQVFGHTWSVIEGQSVNAGYFLKVVPTAIGRLNAKNPIKP